MKSPDRGLLMTILLGFAAPLTILIALSTGVPGITQPGWPGWPGAPGLVAYAQAPGTQPVPPPGCWTQISGPTNPGHASYRNLDLRGVSAVGADDVWAVGSYTPENSASKTFTMHWDGTVWSAVESPSPGGFVNNLAAVAALAHDDVWAVGSYGMAGTDSHALAMHWDGARWSVVQSPNPGLRNNWLAGVSGSARDDVWAVGHYLPGAPNDQRMLLMHWNGSQWMHVSTASLPAGATRTPQGPYTPTFGPTESPTAVPTGEPAEDARGTLSGVVAVAQDEAWAVGTDASAGSNGGPVGAQLMHWDGTTWSRMPVASLVTPSSNLSAISASGPSDVWAVGYGAQDGSLLALHYDGVKWSSKVAPLPASGAIGGFLGVAAIAAGDAWAVGGYSETHGAELPLVEHWDGTRWQAVSSPVSGSAVLYAASGTSAATEAGGNRLYVVGSTPLTPPLDQQPVVLHHTDAPCPPARTPTAQPTPIAPPVPVPGQGSVTFPQTGKTVSGVFLDYWRAHGGLPQQGYPISDVIGEVSDLNGKPYTVQYFERAVFEYHPEYRGTRFEVLLSQLGTFEYRAKYPQGAPGQKANNEPGSVLFRETGHRVGGRLLEYWRANGGLMQQGYPISEEFVETSELDGKSYTVQYFERAVFEYHPENQRPYDVLLSHLGRFRWNQKYGTPKGSPTP